MNNQTTLSITAARKKIFDIAQDVQTPGRYYTCTEKGRPKAVMMSADEFEAWQETLEVTQQFPDLKQAVARVDRAVKTGAYRQYPTLEAVMAEHGFVLAHKVKKYHAVGSPVRSRRAKKSR